MKAIGFSLEEEDASEVDHEGFMRGVIANFEPRCFFFNLEDHLKSDCPQFWENVADIKLARHEKALSGVKARKARLMSHAVARRKEKPQETSEPQPGTGSDDFKIDYKAATGNSLNRVQQELVTGEKEQKVKLELQNERTQEKLNAIEASEEEETKAPSRLSMKLSVIFRQAFVMVPQGSKIQSTTSEAGYQVIRNLSDSSGFTLMHLDLYADYLRQAEPHTESRVVRAL